MFNKHMAKMKNTQNQPKIIINKNTISNGTKCVQGMTDGAAWNAAEAQQHKAVLINNNNNNLLMSSHQPQTKGLNVCLVDFLR